MGLGFIRVRLFTGQQGLPIAKARVLIKNIEGINLYELITNDNGVTQSVPLTAPDKQYSRVPNSNMPRFSVVEVEAPAFSGYKRVTVHQAEIFDTISTTLTIELHPVVAGEPEDENEDEYFIPIEHGVDLPRNPQVIIQATQIVMANEVPIPESITVHLGAPNDNGRNVTVPFVDYIKNVASSEIYPTWDEAALYANIYAQISFALNRVFTVWYRSRGFDFEITNSTAYDQAFIEGRCIFDNISQVVDEIFNNFIRRLNRTEPFFALYCNGTTSTCDGLSQWGAQNLAQQGFTPIQILRNYYPEDIDIVESNNFSENIAIFPGMALREGSTGEDVRLMQLFLNRVHGNYPGIPPSPANRVFGSETRESVIAFQKVFSLIADGIIGKASWYAIIKIFVAVTNLAELTSEGIRLGIGEIPPTAIIQLGSSGALVSELQFLLDYISTFYKEIPLVQRTSRFGEDTKNGVMEFQKKFNLNVDGIVGPATWEKLYTVFHSIENTVNVPAET